MPIRTTLLAILNDVLPPRSAPISDDDNLFALGCTSLMAAYIMDRVNRQLGVNLSILVLVSAPTLAGLASRVEEARSTTGAEFEEGEL